MKHKNITLLTWFNFFTDFQLYAPFAIIYFSKVSGSFALGMSIFSVTMLASAFFEVPTGIFSDRIGRKKTLIVGAISAVAYSIFYAIGQSYWILFLGAIFEGLSRSFYSGNNDALLYDTLAEKNQQEQYAEILGKTSSMFQAALAVSAILGGILAAFWSFPVILWISVISQVVCVYLGFRFEEPKVHSGKSGNIFIHLKDAFKQFLRNKKLRLLSISSILGYGFGEASYLFQSAFYNTLWPLWAIGIAKTASNVLATASFRMSGTVVKKFGGLQLLIIDNIYNRVINILSTAFPTVFSPLFMSSTSMFHGITMVTKNSLMQNEFTNEQRATMGSFIAFGGSIFFCIVAFLLGLVADALTPAQALLFLQVFQIGNLFIYWKLFAHDRDEK